MTDPFAWLAGWIYETALVPVLYDAGLMQWEDIAYGWLLFALYGVAQVVVMLLICAPLERFRRLEHWPDTRAVGVDVLYTLMSRIGVMPLVTFVLFYETQVWLSGALTDAGYVPPTLEGLVPFLMGRQMLTFCIYVLILDCADYWRHRLSHRFGWWYALHAVHHAQRQMSFWSDDRNHVLDDVAAFVWFFAIGLLIGIPPMQFPLVILLLRTLESISHANARVSFGWLGERLLVSPRFHRAHHGVLAAGQRSCNYGAIFPFWDIVFRTADFSRAYVRTGDPSAEEAMATGGWWAQQVAGVRRLARSVTGKRFANDSAIARTLPLLVLILALALPQHAKADENWPFAQITCAPEINYFVFRTGSIWDARPKTAQDAANLASQSGIFGTDELVKQA